MSSHSMRRVRNRFALEVCWTPSTQSEYSCEGQICCSPLLATLLAATSDCVKQARKFAKNDNLILVTTCIECQKFCVIVKPGREYSDYPRGTSFPCRPHKYAVESR